ncbi:unnamed protein product [Cochlearia groenlandica]
MSQRRRPIFQRVTKLLKVSILKRANIPRRLIKLPIKSRRSSKRVKLLKQYNYRFLEEYQSSHSSKSHIRYFRKRIRVSRSSLKRIYRLLFLSWCLGRYNDDHGVASLTRELPLPFDYFSEEDSIDVKAEKFIEKFYDEMRMQAREFA